jgi:hypothetical protein
MYFRALLRHTTAVERHPDSLEVRLDQDDTPLETPVDETPSNAAGVDGGEKVTAALSTTRRQIT